MDPAPPRLTDRARSFVAVHGVRLPQPPPDRAWWREHGIPEPVVDRMAAYQQTWGGLVLPPANGYEGGPKPFCADVPEQDEEGWWFCAGDQRASVPFAFWIGPDDSFCLTGGARATPLYASVEGWVESLALAHHATRWARRTTKLSGTEADALDLAGFEPVPEVQGRADTWWRGPDSLIEVHRGEYECFRPPGGGRHEGARTALVYEGLDRWGLGLPPR
ncbi:hypothetical protein ACIQBJ_14575 [Kitasatospora sp. NPDC088391]|uniref:hypothetical protein n=1 Tax=Kitasatospora sp. NPDC088391 TaxID=3364074 RepID=UPI0037F69F83